MVRLVITQDLMPPSLKLEPHHHINRDCHLGCTGLSSSISPAESIGRPCIAALEVITDFRANPDALGEIIVHAIRHLSRASARNDFHPQWVGRVPICNS